MDITIEEIEAHRRAELIKINSRVESDHKDSERKRLETLYGQVWDTVELTTEFEVKGFLAPYISVTRKRDGKKGSLLFQHSPRFYFNFVEA
jgi:hypothetical protein